MSVETTNLRTVGLMMREHRHPFSVPCIVDPLLSQETMNLHFSKQMRNISVRIGIAATDFGVKTKRMQLTWLPRQVLGS